MLRVAFGTALLLLSSRAHASSGSESALASARVMNLARSPEWLRLVHYRTTSWGGVASDVDGREFFLASRGKEDPEAELDATIRAFYMPAIAGKDDEHAVCRFPARFLWLNERLRFEGRLEPPACDALGRYGASSVEAVSVVYASNYLDNPASAFGHTFLHLKRRNPAGSPQSNDRADYGIDYTATPDTTNPLLYAFKGLTGMFPGYIRLHSFEYKLREYGNYEARDLWEYDLVLTRSEVNLLALHLWELAAAHIDFFYLTGNCSFQIIAALEAAAARLDLLAHVRAPVNPADTIKALVSVPGLVSGVAYRPSLRSQSRALARLRDRRMDYAAPADTRLPVPRDKAPDLSHGSMRVVLGSGATSQYGRAFGTIGYRLALHDLVDPPDGEPELSQLQFLDTRLRYDLGRRLLTLDSLTFAEALALNPLSRFDKAFSWRIRAFGVRLHDQGCPDCFAHGLEGALGGALATEDEHVAVFVLADAYVAFSGALDGVGGSFVRLGVGPCAGLRVRLPAQTIALLTGSWSYLPAQRLQGTYDMRATLRSRLGRDVAVGIEAAMQPYSYEAQVSSYLYF
jgi:hypothetical protein